MRLSNLSGLRSIKSHRFISSIVLILILVCSTIGQMRDIEISSYVQPTSGPAKAYFQSGEFRYGGGVVPMGTAEFFYQEGTRSEMSHLDIHQLELVIRDPDRLRGNQPSYNVIGIKWNGNVYQLTAQNDLIYPLMKFIKRRGYIAYTVPVAGVDQQFFNQNHLVPFRNVDLGRGNISLGYVAQEFNSNSHGEFLKNVDIDRSIHIRSMPTNLQTMIINDVNNGKGLSDIDRTQVSSYVNADFHVKYKVFLENTNGRKFIEIGGLPLRYAWSIATDRSAIIRAVGVFDLPKERYDLQYRAVLFFQTAALLRQFFWDNREEFDRFLNEVKATLGEK